MKRMIFMLVLFCSAAHSAAAQTEGNGIMRSIAYANVQHMPMKFIYYLNSSTYFEYVNNARGIPKEPNIIYISNGKYSLQQICDTIDNEDAIKAIGDNKYVLYTPIYIAQNATLTLENVELRMDVKRAPFIIYNGDLNAHSSVITSWDETASNYGPRPSLTKKQILIFGQQTARPYLLGLHGSTTSIKHSLIKGLGYQGPLSPFGISFNGKPKSRLDPLSFDALLLTLPPPKGELIGNTIEDNFIGVYSNFARNIEVRGNIIRDSVLYNVDPHDESSQLVFAHNIVYGAKNSHGIIFSREVNNSTIHENIVFNNYGSGIMMDRLSEENKITNNFVIFNDKAGISLLESDHNVVTNNRVLFNKGNGILVRNSQHTKIHDNYVAQNHDNGIELMSRSLADHLHRDLKLDPYTELSSAEIENNQITQNHLAAITAKNKFKVQIKNNDIRGSGPHFFGGALIPHSDKIITNQKDQGFEFCALGAKLCEK